jgi:DNA-directed RNA polymerase alpha subunit
MFTEPDKVIKSPKQEYQEIVRGRRNNQRNLHKRPKKLIAQKIPYDHVLTDEQVDALNQCVETIRLELSGGRAKEPRPNPDRAKAAIDRFVTAIATKDTIDRKTPIASLFEVRTANMLESAGIKTIGALMCETRHTLAQIPNIGPATVDQIRVELGIYDLYLTGEKASVFA